MLYVIMLYVIIFVDPNSIANVIVDNGFVLNLG